MRIVLILSAVLSVYLEGSVWISGSSHIHFYDPLQDKLQSYEVSAQQSVLEKNTCSLWVTNHNSLIKFSPLSNTVHSIFSSDHLLGELGVEGSFITYDSETWFIRNSAGQIKSSFPALATSPVELEGDWENGFWTLDYQEKQKSIALVHFNETGKLLWRKIISEHTDLWGVPSLKVDLLNKLIWIGFSVTSTEHAYSPRLELWSTRGERIGLSQSKNRGLFLGACKKPGGQLIMASDLPHSSFSVPLFSFLDLFSSDMNIKRLHTLEQNWLVASLDCSDTETWILQKSLFGGQNSQLVEWSSFMGEKIHLDFQEPTWKIHLCSVQ